MKSFIPFAAALAAGMAKANAAFDINSQNNLVMYWGQSSAGSEQSLGDYCQQTAGDLYVLAFIYEFGNGEPQLNIGGCSETFEGSTILNCPSIGDDIKSCQAAGKKVLLSLGGADGSYGFADDSAARSTANDLWNMYGGGSSDTRPFGDAIVDGFDLDIENNNPKGYPALVSQLRSYFNGASKDYYISAAPQCVYPDASVGPTLSSADIDMAFIQFYNNPCSLTGSFNWDTWQNFAEHTSPNKNIKLFVGLPGSPSAAGSGYVDPSTVQSALSGIHSSNFGGIMLWDASQAFGNIVDGITYAQSMQNILNGRSGSGSSSGSGSAPASSAATSSPVSSTPVAASSAPVEISSAAASTPVVTSASAAATGQNNLLAVAVGSAPSTTAQGPAPTSTPDSTTTEVVTRTITVIDSTYYQTENVVVPTSIVKSSPFSNTSQGPAATSTPDSTIAVINNTNYRTEKVVVPTSIVTSAPVSTGIFNTTAVSTGAPQATAGNCGITGHTACINGDYAVCNFGSWVLFECPAGTVCTVSGGHAFCDFPQSSQQMAKTRRL